MRYILSTVFVILAFSTAVHSQEVSPSLYLSTQPANPSPGQMVTITANSDELNLSQVPVVWKANDKTLPGRGQSISVTAPEAGNTGVITATITGSGFSSITATTILRPAMIDLVWEATDSYVPPFYKGKALPITNSSIQIIGIPSINAPKSMMYTWSKDGTILGSLSGLNKSSYSFRNSELSATESIGLTGTSGNFNSSVSKTIQIETPEIIVYKKEGGFINYANGSNVSLSTNLSGIILRFEPYFFSIANKNPRNLIFNVLYNEEDITNTEKRNELPLSNTDKSVGFVDLQIQTSSPAYLFQNIKKIFKVHFL